MTENRTAINVLRKELFAHVAKEQVMMTRTMRNEMDSKISYAVSNKLKVPDLIGENCPYSTLANFITSFFQNTRFTINECKIKLLDHSVRIEELEKQRLATKKEFDNTHRKLMELATEQGHTNMSI